MSLVTVEVSDNSFALLSGKFELAQVPRVGENIWFRAARKDHDDFIVEVADVFYYPGGDVVVTGKSDPAPWCATDEAIAFMRELGFTEVTPEKRPSTPGT